MLSPSTRRMLLQTRSVGSRRFVVSLQALWSLSHQHKWSLFDDHVQKDWRPVSKIDLRARSMWVCNFAYLIMRIWPHCNLVLMYQWWL
jgi:hypothetical protein